MSRVKHCLAIAALLLMAGPAAAQPPSTATVRELGLDEFIRTAAERDTEFERILADRLFLAYEKTLRLPARDLLLSVRSDYDFVLGSDAEGQSTSVGLSKLFPASGTNVAAAYGLASSSPGGSSASDFSVTLSQPIAENAFGRSTRLLDRIVGLEIDVARHQIVEAYEDYLATLISAYYEWYEAYESLRVGDASYRSTLKLLDNMKARQKSRIALPIDVNKIRLQALAKQATLTRLNEQYKSSLNVIERAVREDLGDAVIPVAPPIPETPDNFLDLWHEDFRKNGRTYQILDLLGKRSALNVDRQAQELLPSIDLLLGYEADGGDVRFKRREERVFTGVAVEWAIPETQARAAREVARLEKLTTDLENENVRYAIYTRLRNLALQVMRERELIAIATETIRLAEDVLASESENYTFGRASLNDYISAVNALDSGRLEKIAREVLLRQLLLEFRRLTDVLVSNDVLEANPARSGR